MCKIFQGFTYPLFGWWWRRNLGPVAILALTLSKVLPLIKYSHASIVEPVRASPDCSLHQKALLFWTFFGACLSEFLLFSLIYWRTLIHAQSPRRWRSGLAGNAILCSAVALVALVSLVIGWKWLWMRRLLVVVNDK